MKKVKEKELCKKKKKKEKKKVAGNKFRGKKSQIIPGNIYHVLQM